MADGLIEGSFFDHLRRVDGDPRMDDAFDQRQEALICAQGTCDR
ncbi:MAG: hypothetical protein VYB08_10420 [Candidatus Latescibacterota bacterium]|nr:hypothetical protein [Candidatus Latescibacterota bacterium]